MAKPRITASSTPGAQESSDVDDDRTNARWKRRKQTVHMCKTHCAPRYYCRFFCLLHTCAAAMWEQTVYNKCVYRKQKTVSAKKKFINKWKTERNWDCSQCVHTPSTNTHTSTRRSLRSAIWKIAPKNHTCSFFIFLFSFCNGFFSSSFSDWFVVCFFFTINVDRCLLHCLLVLFWSSIYVSTKRIFTDFFGLYFFFDFSSANEIYNRSLNGRWRFVLSSFVEKIQNGFGRMSRFSPRNEKKNCIYFASFTQKKKSEKRRITL